MIKQQFSSLNLGESNPYDSLFSELEELKKELRELDQLFAPSLQQVHPQHLADAINLVSIT